MLCHAKTSVLARRKVTRVSSYLGVGSNPDANSLRGLLWIQRDFLDLIVRLRRSFKLRLLGQMLPLACFSSWYLANHLERFMVACKHQLLVTVYYDHPFGTWHLKTCIDTHNEQSLTIVTKLVVRV